MRNCGCKVARPPMCRGRICGCCTVAFAAGMVTALLITSGTAAVLIAISAGCIGIALIK